MECPNCGAELAEGAATCYRCGAELSPPKSRFAMRLQELKWIIIVYVILSLACMSCACVLGYRTQWILWKLGLR
jgi:hypothetical protein